MRPRALCILLAASAVWPAAARAAEIGGYLQWNYSNVSTDLRDASAGRTETSASLFSQQYRIALDMQIFPTVTLNAGGTFERADVTSEVNGVGSDTTQTKILPYVDLTLNTPLLTLGGGYRLNEVWAKLNGVSTPKLVREQTYGRFGYRPDGFPSLDLQVGRNENYDTGRTVRDTVEDYLNVSSQYWPVGTLQLSYLGAFSRFTDQLQNNETRTAQNSGTVSYSGSSWQNRVGYSGMYNILDQRSEFVTGGQGEINTQKFASAGLSEVSSTNPRDVFPPPSPSSPLIDGNTTIASGINIGYNPASVNSWVNIGLEFSANTELNLLYVWVDKPLPSSVANTFKWDVYTSDRNDPGSPWVLWETVSLAPFPPDDNRFEIRFRNVPPTRFVKVVTRPLASLPPGTTGDFRSILVTELQAFLARPAAEVPRSESRTSQTLNLSARVLILEVPSLYYQFNYFFSKATDSSSRYIVSNALNANHQFSPVVSGSARVAVDYSDDVSGQIVTYSYSASLTAVPLPTLTHTLTYYGKTEDERGGRSITNSFYLNNTAELYKGINANLGGGIELGSLPDGADTRTYSLIAGVGLIPHRTLNVNMSYNGSKQERTGGGLPDANLINRIGGISASFTPLRTVYLTADWTMSNITGQPQFTTTSFGAGWSPFPGGTLQFNFPYTETRRSSDNSTDRGFSPSVRWNITQRASLTLSYAWFHGVSDFQDIQTDAYNANLRITF